ncbi:MAG: hypothetical protein WC333_00225 [Dehalococcoidia bacterium]|jgi:hypothetical protein
MNKPTITTTSADKFAQLEKLINELPTRIVDQLENVCFGIGQTPVGRFREKFETIPTIIIPNNTMNIIHHDDMVVICTPNWIFQYPLKTNNKNCLNSAEKVNFVLIDPKEDDYGKVAML